MLKTSLLLEDQPAAEPAREGDLDVQVQVETEDEIRELADAFIT